MQPSLVEWECEGLPRPRFNFLRCWLWDTPRSIQHRIESWGETLEETYGEKPEVVIEAYAYVKDLRDKWMRGIAWHDRNPEHLGWDANWERTEQRGREYGAAGDEFADWLGCSVTEMREVLEFEEAQR